MTDAETPSDLPDGAAGEHADVDAVETPSDLPDDAATGHADVDAAVQRLADLDGLPVDQHGEVLDEIHGRLRDALTAAASPAPDRADG
jgi:hypothetical protein